MATRSRKLESKFQADLIKELHELFPGCEILKNDANYRQGILDLLILFHHNWAMLEVKRGEGEPHQPNQDYYAEKFNDWSFAAFIYPENKEEVLHDLQQAFGTRR
jgi:Holliday junction resolvase-like predicted endonuclease